jgi:hypothetical protein
MPARIAAGSLGSIASRPLAAEEIVVCGPEADVHATRIAREVAVMAVNEYKEGTFRQEFAVTESGIKLAEAELSRAKDNLDWVRGIFEKGYTTMAEKVTAELVLKHARFALELGQTKKKILIDYSRPGRSRRSRVMSRRPGRASSPSWPRSSASVPPRRG